MNEKENVLIQVSRIDFWSFCCYYDFDFFRVKRPFLNVIALSLQDIYDRIIITLSVSMPPRAGKSYIISLFLAWVIGKEPDESMMRNSCTSTLYRKFSYDVRDIVKSQKFKNVFPDVTLSIDKSSVDGWNVKQAKQVSYFGNGVGGTIIGFGASRIAATDDLYRGHEDAFSPTINERVHNWYNSAHKSRVESGCAVIDIGTRWSKKDIIGVNTSNGFYERSIVVPALINGKSFCEDVKTTKEYLKLKSETSEIIWNSEYMQEPVELKGSLFAFSKLNRYKTLNDEGASICYIDTADEGKDHFAGLFGKLLGDKFYVTDAIFNTHNLTINEPVCKERFERHEVDRVYIESNSFGAYFARNLRDQNPSRFIVGDLAKSNKMGRIISQSGPILQRFVWPENPNNELSMFMNQMSDITPDSKDNDDAADCTAGLSARIRRDYFV